MNDHKPRPSDVPAPIERLKAGGYGAPIPKAPPIDWDQWRKMPQVALWQAVALAVNENPDTIDFQKPSDAFERCLRIALSNAEARALPLSVHYPANPRVSRVSLALFVEWAKGLNLPKTPPELLALVQQGTNQGSTTGPVSFSGAKPSKGVATGPKTASKTGGHAQSVGTPVFNMTKAALVKAHKHEWPTIESDLAHASENKLDAARAGKRDWYEAAALDWARAKGKLTGSTNAMDALTHATHSMVSLPTRQHKQER